MTFLKRRTSSYHNWDILTWNFANNTGEVFTSFGVLLWIIWVVFLALEALKALQALEFYCKAFEWHF